MKKYRQIFTTSWQNEFTYRLNFILWRVRNVLRYLMTYFLWAGIFTTQVKVYDYSQTQIITYIFLVLFVGTLIISAPSADSIGAEIGSGDISNYLVKPVSYLKFWFTRDLASKSLNLLFAVIEGLILWLLLRPHLQLEPSFFSLIGFLAAVILAILSYFLLSCLTRFVAFWTPENTWGFAFVVLVLMEILAGGIFPLDILPSAAQIALQFTPFPYLIYYPIAILLGKITGLYLLRILFQSALYLFILHRVTSFVWHKGLTAYASEGR